MIVYPRRPSWFRLFFTPHGGILPRIWPQLAIATGIAVAVTAYYEVTHERGFSMTATPFTLIAVALAIFLGFRNNASYDRHWEGRRIWGTLVDTARSFARQALTLVDGPASDEPAIDQERRRLVRGAVAFVHALRAHLRGQDPAPDLARLLESGEVAALAGEKNVPYAVLQVLGDRLRNARRRGWIHDLHLPVLERSLVEMTGVLGGCERIQNTPLPFAYTVLIHRIAGFYCFTLPFGIVDTVGYMTPIVVLLIAYAFFGLDAIGDEIQDPFGTDANDLPLEALSRTIEINLRQRLGETDLPAPAQPRDSILV